MSKLTNKVLGIDWMGDTISKNQLGNHHTKAGDVAKALNLENSLAYVSSYHHCLNKPAHYHGLTNSVITFMNAVEGGIVSGLNDSDLKCLAIAALFHDIGHSCGGHSDKYNIQTAVSLFQQQRSVLPELMNLTDDETNLIIKAIQATFYPWKIYAELHITGKILRDADMMGAYIQDPATCTELFVGLMNEISLKKPFGYTVAEFLTEQDKFRTTLIWNTRWGKVKSIALNWPAQFQRIRKLMTAANPA